MRWDLDRLFVACEVFSFEDLVAFGSVAKIKVSECRSCGTSGVICVVIAHSMRIVRVCVQSTPPTPTLYRPRVATVLAVSVPCLPWRVCYEGRTRVRDRQSCRFVHALRVAPLATGKDYQVASGLCFLVLIFWASARQVTLIS